MNTHATSLSILYEDEGVIVFEKPAGVLVHAAPGHDGETMVDALISHAPHMRGVGEDPMRPGIVHRLDKLASGVMIAAKTQNAFAHLKRQFVERRVQKEYLALVYGKLPRDEGTITFPLVRSKKSGKMVAKPNGGEGKEAITHYEVIQRFKTATLLRVRIETGRTHQIRAHVRAIDHPLVGDPLYFKKHMRHIRPIKLPRIFLHAERLTIELPNGETKTFIAPLPAELSDLLQILPKP
jgi:23S rRNA pseudouridine1911/1915/1917 synthase